MNHRNTRDLAWWHIRQWAPAPFRIITVAVPSTLGAGFALGLIFGLVFGVTTGIVAGFAGGLANGVAIGLTAGLREEHRNARVHRPQQLRWRTAISQGNRAAVLATGLTSAAVAGIAGGITVGRAQGLTAGVEAGLAAGLVFGLAHATTTGLLEARTSAGPRRLTPLRWKTVVSRGNLAVGLAFGLMFGLAFGLKFGPVDGLAGGTAFGLAFGIINGLVQISADTSRAIDPIGCWRNDRRSGLAEGLAFGLTTGLSIGLAGWFANGIETGLTLGLITGLGEGIAFTLGVSQAWLATLGLMLLSSTGHFPRQGLRFLEDARKREVLRTVGSMYQFRHARLQDQLATTHARHLTTR
jgi:hypothetical protein